MLALSVVVTALLSGNVPIQANDFPESNSAPAVQVWQRTYSAYGSGASDRYLLQSAVGLVSSPHQSKNSAYHLTIGFKVRETTRYLFRDNFEGR